MEISSVIVQIFERTRLEPDVRIGKKQLLEGKGGKEGWPKIISTNIFVPSRTTGFRRTIHFSFFLFSLFAFPISSLAIFVSCDAFVAPEAC